LEPWGGSLLRGAPRASSPFLHPPATDTGNAGRPAREFTIVDCVPNVSFADESRFGPISVRLTHRLERLDDGSTKIVHGVVVDGNPEDEATIGPRIAADFEPTLARLVALAEA